MIVNCGAVKLRRLLCRSERIHATDEPGADSATNMGSPTVSQFYFYDGDPSGCIDDRPGAHGL